MFLAGMLQDPFQSALMIPNLDYLGCVQNVITGHSPVVNDWPISTETEHMAEKVLHSAYPVDAE